jgi:hypothetical protein
MPQIYGIDGVYTPIFQVKKYEFFVVEVVLHTSVSIVIVLRDAVDNEIHKIVKKIEGDEYNAWGTDDSYLEDIVDKVVKEFLNIQ